MRAFFASIPRQVWIIIGVIWTVCLVVVVLSIAGCAASGGYSGGGTSDPGTVRTGGSGDFTEHTVTLSDGRTVVCLTWATYDYMNESMKSGMDCLEAKPE